MDFLLETIIHKKDSFNALLIIDELDEELESVLINRFNFTVETIILKRFKNKKNEILYSFYPFLIDVIEDTEKVDITDLDTIIVPAKEDGFNEVFLGENRWYSVRLNSSMIPKIKYIASYQVSPVSAITYLAEVKTIEQWENTNKYVIYFQDSAEKIDPVVLGKSKGKAPQNIRYTSKEKLLKVKTLDELF